MIDRPLRALAFVPTDPLHEPLRRLFSFLAHLGWQIAPRAQARTLKAPQGELGWYALSLPDGATLIAVSLSEELPSSSTSYRRFEDFSPLHRRIQRILRSHDIQGRYLLLLSGFRAHLIDQRDDDLLLAVESRDEWDNRLLPILDFQALARGALSSFPRKSNHQRARELADWTHFWSARIGSRIETSPTVMARFFDWLHLSRVAIRRNHVLQPESAPGTRKYLEDCFRLLADTYNLLQGTSVKTQLHIADEAHRAGLLAECLESYGLLSHSKIDAATFAEAFADEALRLLSWRASVVAGPTLSEGEPEEFLAASQRSYEVDLDNDGTAVLLRRFDDLVTCVVQVALNYERSLERGERLGVQLDLLATSFSRPESRDAVRHVLRHILRVRTTDSRRGDLARLLLASRAVEIMADAGLPLRPFPLLAIEVRGPRDREVAFPASDHQEADTVLN